MRNIALISMAAFAISAFANLPSDMRELMVDDAGNLNSTNAVATQADLARIASSNQLAVAEQNAVKKGYDQAVDLLGAVATNIAAGTPIVFYSVELTSFDSAVVFDEQKDKICICDFESTREIATMQGVECEKYAFKIAFTADLQTVKPMVAYAQVLNGAPRSDWDYLSDDLVTDPVLESEDYTDKDGNTYSHVYSLYAWFPKEGSGFSYVRIPNDAAIADGATINLPNGVKGGATTTVVWGGKTLKFIGGLLVEVVE